MSESKIKRLDLKGEVCPYTFVKSKLIIEEMELGELLEVFVDHTPAVKNVPRSMEMEGQEVVEVSQIKENEWKIVLRKQQ
jgi:TusA-related sulfurtransferase